MDVKPVKDAQPPTVNNNWPFFSYIPLIIDMIVLLALFFELKLAELFTPFLWPIMRILLFAAFAICSVWVLISLIKFKRKNAILFLIVNLITFALILFLPFRELYSAYNFKLNLEKRNQVIQMIKSGALNIDSEYEVYSKSLPNGYKALSSGGKIFVQSEGEDFSVLFFTYQGILDNYIGFVYDSDDHVAWDDFDTYFYDVKKMQDYWYQVYSS